MKDEYGRLDNKSQAIRNLDKVRMAHLLNNIKQCPDKYPDSVEAWIEWLNLDSGDTIDTL